VTHRRPIFAANWKMNLLHADAERYAERLRGELDHGADADVVLFPPFTLLPVIAERLAGGPVAWGGQDLHPEDGGAHTGDVAAAHLLDWDATWALCGHSERRADHGESDALIAAKVAQAQRHGLVPLLCVGETAAEREEDRTAAVLRRQLEAAMPLPTGGPWALAYEPVWAIGTGRTATPDLAQAAHALLRAIVAERLGADAAAGLRILYGGSVKPENSAELHARPDIDGFLVGGASLDPGSFLDIIRRCAANRPASS
jgi:triosephosphate isomerase (TIM)